MLLCFKPCFVRFNLSFLCFTTLLFFKFLLSISMFLLFVSLLFSISEFDLSDSSFLFFVSLNLSVSAVLFVFFSPTFTWHLFLSLSTCLYLFLLCVLMTSLLLSPSLSDENKDLIWDLL